MDIRARDLDEGWVLLSQQRFDDLHACPPDDDADAEAEGAEDAAATDLSSSPPDDWGIETYLTAPRKSKKRGKKQRGKKKH